MELVLRPPSARRTQDFADPVPAAPAGSGSEGL